MTTATSNKSLKRLSLLQSPTAKSASSSTSSPDSVNIRFKPQQLDNVSDPAGPSSKTHSSFQSSPSSPSSSSPASAPPAGSAWDSKSTRRHSSISYFSQDREHNPQRVSTPVDSRRFSIQQGKNSRVTRGGLLNQEPTEETEQPRVDRPPLTLAERHADLLHFIAQKESKCLELRSQLAMHEAELLALKRKWTRIISRTYGDASSASLPSPETGILQSGPSTTVVLSGFRESMQGVGRFIANLSELSAQDIPIEKEKGQGHESTSSVSTSSFTTASVRLSQSSLSSVDDHVADSKEENQYTDDAIGSSLENKLSKISPKLSNTVSPTVQGTKPIRRKVHGGLYSTPLKVHTNQTPTSPLEAPPKSSPKSAYSHLSHQKRPSLTSGTLPPPSSIPGLSTISISSGVSTPPFSQWVDTVGKKFSKLPSGNALHKRASTLLSDASGSFFAALASPARPSIFGAFEGATVPRSPIALTTSHTESLLDDSDSLEEGVNSVWKDLSTLTPDQPSPVASSPTVKEVSLVTTKTANAGVLKSTDEESDDWNW